MVLYEKSFEIFLSLNSIYYQEDQVSIPNSRKHEVPAHNGPAQQRRCEKQANTRATQEGAQNDTAEDPAANMLL